MCHPEVCDLTRVASLAALCSGLTVHVSCCCSGRLRPTLRSGVYQEKEKNCHRESSLNDGIGPREFPPLSSSRSSNRFEELPPPKRERTNSILFRFKTPREYREIRNHMCPGDDVRRRVAVVLGTLSLNVEGKEENWRDQTANVSKASMFGDLETGSRKPPGQTTGQQN